MKKLFLSPFLVALFLFSSCGANEVLSYNKKVTDSYNTIIKIHDEWRNQFNAEAAKGAYADLDAIEKVRSDAASKHQAEAQKIRNLTAPQGEGVAEFTAAVNDFLKGADNQLNVIQQFIQALKSDDFEKLTDLTEELEKSDSVVDDLISKVTETQKVMAEKNGFRLE